jgi:hypothetical protein
LPELTPDSPREAIGNGSLRRVITPESKSESMKTTVTEFQFVESFRACGRESQFSRDALLALFEYLEEYESSTGTELELDPIAVCCDFAEYPSALEAAKAYGYQESIDSKDETPLEWLQNRTQVIEFEGGVVIQQF